MTRIIKKLIMHWRAEHIRKKDVKEYWENLNPEDPNQSPWDLVVATEKQCEYCCECDNEFYKHFDNSLELLKMYYYKKENIFLCENCIDEFLEDLRRGNFYD